MATPARKKPITVHRVRKVLHIGIDLAAAPWSGALVRAMPRNIENHATHADDATAALLQLHRPEFPTLSPRAGPGPMNRMARVMKNYELVVCHGEAAFPATMAHTLFGEALKLPPLVHYVYGVGEVPRGWWQRFGHKLGTARTSRLVVPSVAAARSVARDWHVTGSRIHILPPVFPDPPGRTLPPDAIPRLVKRDGEKWLAMRASDAAAFHDKVVSALAGFGDDWHLVVFGEGEHTAGLRRAMDEAGLAHLLHETTRFHGPGAVAGLVDLAVLDGRDGLIPPDMPALMAAGVPLVSVAPLGLAELLPEPSVDLRCDTDGLGAALETAMSDDVARERAGAANAAFAARHGDTAPHLALLAEVMGLSSLEQR